MYFCTHLCKFFFNLMIGIRIHNSKIFAYHTDTQWMRGFVFWNGIKICDGLFVNTVDITQSFCFAELSQKTVVYFIVGTFFNLKAHVLTVVILNFINDSDHSGGGRQCFSHLEQRCVRGKLFHAF